MSPVGRGISSFKVWTLLRPYSDTGHALNCKMAESECSRKITKKRTVIAISSSPSSSSYSSSSSSSGEENSQESKSESENSDPSSGYSLEEIASDNSSSDDDEEDNSDDEENEGKDEESMSNGVIHLLHERSDLEELTLIECKAYLRRHGLRLSGTRAECIQRIKEHWRLKDGSGDILYPKSSFIIDCTGDVCRGDVVLFTQKVYKNFDKAARRGSLLGKRTVAGRIVKESYGAAKQQHTFTVEVLWSKGIKRLSPLFPLLVKGRNLYKMKTFRQCWKNEKERSKVLAEKHKRGAAARQIREMRRTKAVKRTRKKSLTHEGSRKAVKRAKGFLHSSSFEMSLRTVLEGESRVDGRGKGPSGKQKSHHLHQKASPLGQSNFKEVRKFSVPSSQRRHRNPIHQPEVGEASFEPYAYPQKFNPFQPKQCHYEPPYFVYSDYGSAPTRNWPPYPSHSHPFLMPSSARPEIFNYDFHPHYGHPTHVAEHRNWNYFRGPTNTHGPFQPFPYTSRSRR